MAIEIVELVILKRPHEGSKADQPQQKGKWNENKENGHGPKGTLLSADVFDLAQSISIGWTR